MWSKLLALAVGFWCGTCFASDDSVDMQFALQVAQEMRKCCKNEITEALSEQNKLLQRIISNNKELVEINNKLVEANRLLGENYQCLTQLYKSFTATTASVFNTNQKLQQRCDRLAAHLDASIISYKELDAKYRKCKALEYTVRLVDCCILAGALYCGYWSWAGTGF